MSDLAGTKRIKANWLVAMALVMAVGSVAVVQAAPVQAATSFKEKCGKGYQHKKTKKFKRGKVIVFTKQQGKKTDWCAFTVRTGKARGDRDWTSIFVTSKNTNRKEAGHYKHYAGPVKLSNSKRLKVYGELIYINELYTPSMSLSN